MSDATTQPPQRQPLPVLSDSLPNTALKGNAEPNGLLFPASLVFAGDSLLVTNLSLDLRLFGSNTVDAQWAAQVRTHTLARLPRRIPKLGEAR